MEQASRELSTSEIEKYSTLLEESATTNKSLEKFLDEAARDQATLFRHTSGCSAQPDFRCNCSFARMNFAEMSVLDAATQSRLGGLNTNQHFKSKCPRVKITRFAA